MNSEEGDFIIPTPAEKEKNFIFQEHIIKTCLEYWLDALEKNKDEPIYNFWLIFYAITALNASLALALDDTSGRGALSKKSGKRKHQRQWGEEPDKIKKIRAKIARGEKISPEEEKTLNKYYKESVANLDELIKRAEGDWGKFILKKPLSLSEEGKEQIDFLIHHRSYLVHGKILKDFFVADDPVKIEALIKPVYRIIYDVLFGENAPKSPLYDFSPKRGKISPIINAMSEFYKYPEKTKNGAGERTDKTE